MARALASWSAGSRCAAACQVELGLRTTRNPKAVAVGQSESRLSRAICPSGRASGKFEHTDKEKGDAIQSIMGSHT